MQLSSFKAIKGGIMLQLGVCPSVMYKAVFYQNGWMHQQAYTAHHRRMNAV